MSANATFGMTPSSPQVDRQQHANRERQTEEVDRFRGRPGPRAVHHVVRNPRGHELIVHVSAFAAVGRRNRRGRRCGRPNLGMANLTAERCRPAHDRKRDDRQDRRRSDEPSSGVTDASRLPQRDPRDEASKLCQREAGERRVLVHSGGDVGEVGSAPQMVIRRRASDIHRHCHDRDDEQHLEAQLDEGLLTTDEGDEQESQRHGSAERRDVIENEVKMSGVQDEERIHGPRYATR
jgi:hypothetical protein